MPDLDTAARATPFGIEFSEQDLPRILGLSPIWPMLTDEGIIDHNRLIGMALNVINNPGGTVGDLWHEIGTTLQVSGRPDLADFLFKGFHQSYPSPGAYLAYMHNTLLDPAKGNDDLHQLSKHAPTHYPPSEIDKSADELDRVENRYGLVCEFFDSPTMRNGMLPTLISLIEQGLDVYCYSDGPIPKDDPTFRAINWRETGNLDTESFARMVRNDELTVIRDLNGPTARNRLPAFAARLAPIQIPGANFMATLGLPSFDFILVTANQIPPEEDRFYTEKIHRHPMFFGASIPAHDRVSGTPKPRAAPHTGRDHITFGYFGSTHKINPRVVALWSRVLNQIPSARLILKAAGYGHASIREHFLSLFQRNGVDTDRIELRGAVPYLDMLKEYGDIDIMLDTFPVSGGSTLHDAIWQGVATVSLHGNRWSTRAGSTILTTIGVEELVAQSETGYVELCRSLADNPVQVRSYRGHLREQALASNFFNHDAYRTAFVEFVRAETR